jgi:ABC-type sugar transport system ATPase subunit
MAEVNLIGARKNYGSHTVVPELSLTVPDGSFTVLVGPSGCGKSTLLRMIAGLESMSGGQIEIGGRDVTHTIPSQRGIAMVFQSYALYPHMSVRDNISFGLRLAKLPQAEIDAKVYRAAAILQLEPYLDRKPANLSGGQRQRVAIGRSIVREPDVFLFDEPLSNLDAALRGQMRVELLDLHRTLGSTMIYVTHDQVEAMTMADQIVVLNKGRIEQVGTPLELYDRPKTPFVAAFIGSPKMNLISGPEAERRGGDLVGIRPEDAAITRGGDGWRGRVRLVEQLGSDVLVHVRTKTVGEVIVRMGRQDVPSFGDEVGVTAMPARYHVFRDDVRITA